MNYQIKNSDANQIAMQSAMDSWQFETFSTAELSPPISPAPPSPTLYSYSNVNGVPSSPYSPSTEFDNLKPVEAQKIMLQKQDPPLQQAVSAQTRAEVATNILKDLEKLGDMSFKNHADFGGNWMEESVNLELFEELSEFAYDPPSSPESYTNETIQSSYPVISSQSPSHLSEVSLHNGSLQQSSSEYVSEDFDQLKAEFQAILESLPTDPGTYGEVINIIGIPTTLVGDEELIPLDYADNSLEDNMGVEMEMEVNSIEDDPTYLIDEQDVYKMEDDSIDLSNEPSSPEDSVNEDEDDIEANTAEKILDALLQGDLQVAESYIPVTVAQSPPLVCISDNSSTSYISENSSTSYTSDAEEYILPVKKVKAVAPKTIKKLKTERRGRKPASNKKSLAYVSDKALRKKEQNKTAATRYRQKKKMETHVILDQEAQLQSEHDELAKQKEDLYRQIVMVKQLLREVVQAKKVTKKVTVNRRKL